MPAAAPQQNPLAPDLHLPAGYIVRFCAIDAATGAEVPNVIVRDANLQVTNMVGGDLDSGKFVTVNPVLVPVT